MDEIEIIRTITTLIQLRKKKLHKSRIRHRDMMVLDMILRKENQIKMSELSELFSVSKAAVSQEIDHLEALGWVQRKPSMTDKRTTYLSVTSEGQERLHIEQDRLKHHFSDFLQELGNEDSQALVRILQKAIAFNNRGDLND